jgi:hypothetical protein
MGKLIVSHSEVDQYLSCERKHYYAFGKGLQSNHQSESLTRGTLGHEVLEVYYKSIQQGISPDDSAMNALDHFQVFIGKYDLGLLADLQNLLLRYFAVAPAWDETYEILHVEDEFRLDISEDIQYPYKPDLIVQDRLTSRIFVLDHKFIYNFYTVDDMKISPQLPKYIGALRANGIKVHGGLYNMLRWRKVKSTEVHDNFRREGVPINNNRIAITFQEQVTAMEQIGKLKKMDRPTWEKHVLRTASSFNCKNCAFHELCTLDLTGEDTTMAEKYSYEKNTYGYLEKASE